MLRLRRGSISKQCVYIFLECSETLVSLMSQVRDKAAYGPCSKKQAKMSKLNFTDPGWYKQGIVREITLCKLNRNNTHTLLHWPCVTDSVTGSVAYDRITTFYILDLFR